ncbi:hypothetical protein FHT82_005670 [Rhizobium sp. BK275]|uniref:hypothetical protein n=1 Tax=unclassified Rhizobium TaxID=2613769 RepID=UPI001616CA05|nr:MULTISPECIES: hypothetical protein [unclassified Rhizobium]MBB3392881.1 hypothetical protein [Rhizobium sp. BK275]MBB3409913.1 hypothetical protein [Rhizobium sp. BK316]
MHFLGVFAIGSLIGAGIFHVGMLIAFERLANEVNKYGPNLVTKIGKGLPEIDLRSQAIPSELKSKFVLYRRAWAVVISIFMMPVAVYLFTKAFVAAV